MKYHLTPEGPKRCVAKTPASCRASFQGEAAPHYEGQQEAQKAFEDAFSPHLLRKHATPQRRWAPPRAPLKPLTEEEAREALARSHEYWSPGYRREAPHLLAYTLTGSLVYELDTPESDRDLLTVVTNRVPKFQKVFPDGTDISVISLGEVTSPALNRNFAMMDLLRSRSFSYVDDPLQESLKHLRMNENAYLNVVGEFARGQVYDAVAFEKDTSERRRMKHLKAALRSYVLMYRVEEGGLSTPVTFQGASRETFYRTWGSLQELLDRQASAEEVLRRLEEEAPRVA